MARRPKPLTVDEMAHELARLPGTGLLRDELHQSIARIIGDVDAETRQDALDQAAEIVRRRMANLEAESARLTMLTRLADATHMPQGMSVYTWLESLQLVERDGDTYTPTAKAGLRAV